MGAEQAADSEAGDAEPAVRRDAFDDVFGSAINEAVRRAVDGVGRDPLGDLSPASAPVAPPTDTERIARKLAQARRAAADDAARAPLPTGRTTDPYELLGVSRRAPWADITAAYKARARAWHPDGAPVDEQARRHELIRELNAAYAELRVRRGH